MIALYAPDEYRVKQVLRGHTDRVNSVSWIPNTSESVEARWKSPETELVSGSSDKTVMVWRKSQSSDEWEASAVLQGHADSVTHVAVLTTPNGQVWLASTSADRTMKIWRRDSGPTAGEWTCLQTFDYAPKMMECVALTHIPGTNVVLMAAAGVDLMIHLYVCKLDGQKFHRLLELHGHEDWIRSLAFTRADNGDVFLASSAQDNYIRLWKIARSDAGESSVAVAPLLAAAAGDDAPDEAEADDEGAGLSREDIEQRRGKRFKLGSDGMFIAVLESILYGHDDWVYSVRWHPTIEKQGVEHQPMALLSASMDRSMAIWRPDPETGVWLNDVRVGELGGNALGFFGGLFGPEGLYILAHGYNGAFHLWKRQVTKVLQGEGVEDLELEAWEPCVTVSGHFGSVEDVSWDPSQRYVVSVSKDQTTRLFAPWKRTPTEGEATMTWHEVARPQIHGYDMSCLAFVNGASHRFVSGADEKVIRVFDAPRTFVATLAAITGVAAEPELAESRPLGANVPPLGLSNKPVFEGEERPAEAADGMKFREEAVAEPVVLGVPPFEEHLMQSTLWPEIYKLYGHGDNLVCLASSRSGKHIASACKGSKPEQCGVIVWETDPWKKSHQVYSHTLTVTQLEYSHDDAFLCSASRDRCLSIFSTSAEAEYKLVAKIKAHDRIIWSCSWSHDDAYLATGSRDKKVKVWRKGTSEKDGQQVPSWSLDSSLLFKTGVNAVAFFPIAGEGTWRYLLAVGLENGLISLWVGSHQADTKGLRWTSLISVPPSLCPVDTVKRLSWRKPTADAAREQATFDLAVGASDHSVRILSFTLHP